MLFKLPCSHWFSLISGLLIVFEICLSSHHSEHHASFNFVKIMTRSCGSAVQTFQISPCFLKALCNNILTLILHNYYQYADSYVLSFLITGPHNFLVALVGPAGPSPTTTWRTIPQLTILTTSTLTPCTGRPYAPYVLSRLLGSSLHRVMVDGVVIPPAI